MLEVSSSMDLPRSAQPEEPYFLELYGETSPQIDPDYAQVLATKSRADAGPIYEYFWTLGRYDPPRQQSGNEDPHRGLNPFHRNTSADGSGWGKFSAGSFA